LVLLRHGRTGWNAERRFQGQADPPLDDIGRAQAHVVADLIAALRPDVLLSSDLLRAMETAEVVGRRVGLDVTPDARLRERSLGHWEGLTREEVGQRYPEELADWLAGRDVRGRGGESRDEVAERALRAFDDAPPAATTLIVTHSATAMALSARLLGLDQALHVLGPLANCHWSELTCEDGHAPWRLRAHNIGSPGTVVPLPLTGGPSEDAPDAEA
jgi:probable phosphoglycerate mutase